MMTDVLDDSDDAFDDDGLEYDIWEICPTSMTT